MNARQHFDSLYAASADPWQVHSSPYERRKAALVMAALPRERYAYAFEPACGAGALTRLLAARCERVLAADFSPSAIGSARAHLAGTQGVELQQLSLPHEWPGAHFDLVVLAEILYYLEPADLAATLQKCRALQAHADLVACHARASFDDRQLDAPALARQLRDVFGEPSARYEEPAFVVEAWAAQGLPVAGACE